MIDGRRLKAIAGGSAGNLVEWFDWYVYAAFTLYFAPHFFPAGNRTVELLSAAAVFALGFVMRPVGAWIMGIYADRKGRKAALTLSVTLMCAGSLMIALTPGYKTIGLAAPALLLVARLTQGLSVGGEYGASATYLSEMAGRRHRGFYSSFQYVTLISGQLLAILLLLVLQSALSEKALDAWGWRIPFAVGALLAIVVFYMRRGLIETESFANVSAAERRRTGLRALVAEHPREALTVVFLTAGGTLAFYAYPIFTALETIRDPVAAGLIAMGALVIVTGYSSISAVVKAELFPAHIRALGVALPYAIANTVFGGTAEFVALGLKQIGYERGFYIYVSIMIGVSLVVYIRMREPQANSKILED